MYQLTVGVWDARLGQQRHHADCHVRVSVLDVNDNAPMFDKHKLTFAVNVSCLSMLQEKIFLAILYGMLLLVKCALLIARGGQDRTGKCYS